MEAWRHTRTFQNVLASKQRPCQSFLLVSSCTRGVSAVSAGRGLVLQSAEVAAHGGTPGTRKRF